MNFSLRRIPDLALAVLAISLSAMGAIAKPQPSGNPVAPPVPVAPTAEWQSFLSPDKRFFVLMPTTPQHRQKQTQNGITVHAYTSTQNSQSYAISYFDVDSATTAQSALDAMPGVIASSGGAKLSNLRNITLQGNPGREFNLTGSQLGVSYQAKMRIYAVGQRIYTASSNCTTQDCQKFFDSFKLN
jgi:hypothetical protein